MDIFVVVHGQMLETTTILSHFGVRQTDFVHGQIRVVHGQILEMTTILSHFGAGQTDFVHGQIRFVHGHFWK